MHRSVNLLVIAVFLLLNSSDVVPISTSTEVSSFRSAGADARKESRTLRALNSAGFSQASESFATKLKTFIPGSAQHAAAKRAKAQQIATARMAASKAKFENDVLSAQSALLSLGLEGHGDKFDSAIRNVISGGMIPGTMKARDKEFLSGVAAAHYRNEPKVFRELLELATTFSDAQVKNGVAKLVKDYNAYYTKKIAKLVLEKLTKRPI
uniref:RxLR effector protein n=1 Tax=Peronospora matthiolae TaxID=2874970 RepID=A0AAV1TQR5_9STRA